MKTRDDFIDAILGMNYGELCDVAAEFAAMIDPDVRPKIETKEQFADLLFDWAEAQRQ